MGDRRSGVNSPVTYFLVSCHIFVPRSGLWSPVMNSAYGLPMTRPAVYSNGMCMKKSTSGEYASSNPFDPFGRWQRNTTGEEQRVCAMPECSRDALYKAPRDRQLQDYVWLCLEHVQEYNRKWNYYAGMSASELENEIRRDSTWQRPTWKMGALGSGKARWSGAAFHDPFRVFGHEDEEPFAHNRWKKEHTLPKYGDAEERALKTMGLAMLPEMDDLKDRYKALVKANHPDLHADDPHFVERLKNINEAYRVLSDLLKERESF